MPLPEVNSVVVVVVVFPENVELVPKKIRIKPNLPLDNTYVISEHPFVMTT